MERQKIELSRNEQVIAVTAQTGAVSFYRVHIWDTVTDKVRDEVCFRTTDGGAYFNWNEKQEALYNVALNVQNQLLDSFDIVRNEDYSI